MFTACSLSETLIVKVTGLLLQISTILFVEGLGLIFGDIQHKLHKLELPYTMPRYGSMTGPYHALVTLGGPAVPPASPAGSGAPTAGGG